MAKKRGRKPSVPAEFKTRRDFERAIRRDAKTLTVKEVATKYGKSDSFVRTILKKPKA